MTLIRRMHSLGHGEGRVGLLSPIKYMHGLQDGTGLKLGADVKERLCVSHTEDRRACGGALAALLT